MRCQPAELCDLWDCVKVHSTVFTCDKTGMTHSCGIKFKKKSVFFMHHLCTGVGDALNRLHNTPQVRAFMLPL